MSHERDDDPVLARWWQTFCDTGALPAELERVQGRLIRSVHRGVLPSGPVFVKTMAFPRSKDRVRYLLRPLPAAHEAAMLRHTAAAGLPCPEVLAVRCARRVGLPFRSLLVLRSLPVVPERAPPRQRLEDEVVVAQRLLAAGILHRDLHTENFVRQQDGALAVLDMQSASRLGARARSASARLAVATRLLRDRAPEEREPGIAFMLERGLLRDAHEQQQVRQRCVAAEAHHREARLRRCFVNSTGFRRTLRPLGVEYRVRDGHGAAAGRWWRPAAASGLGGRELGAAWLGQRRRFLATGAPPPFLAFFRKWWWLGGGGALYVPASCTDEWTEAEVRRLLEAEDRARSGA